MRKSFKALPLILAGIMLTSTMFAGCSKNTGVGDGKNEPSTNTQDAGSSKEDITLKFYSWNTDQAELDQAVADAYKEKNPNITVNFEYFGDMVATEYYKKVDLMLMGGEEMDIVMTAAFPEHSQRAIKGSYLPLDEYFAQEGVKPEEVYTVFSPVDDKLYGVPGDLKSWFVLLNKNHLDEAGLPVPPLDWTWDDYREYAQKLTKGEGVEKRYGSYFHSWDHYNYLGVWSTKLDNPILKSETELNFDDPVYKNFLQFRYDMENVDKSQVPYSDVKALNLNYRAKFFNGEVSMLPIGTWMIPEISDQEKYPHDFVTTVAPLPRWGTETPDGRTFTQAQYYSIAKTSKHPKEAYDFIRFYTTEGTRIKGVSISSEANTNKMDFVSKMMIEKSNYDVEAFEKVMNNPNWFDNINNISPVFQKPLATMMLEECEKFLLGGATLDETIETLKIKGQKIIDEYK